MLSLEIKILRWGGALAYECPEIELLAAYIDHKISAEARERVESHLADCSLCRETIALALKSRIAVPDLPCSDTTDR